MSKPVNDYPVSQISNIEADVVYLKFEGNIL
jgi:hypothetical protein